MTPIEREELVRRIKALSAEERKLVIDNLPAEELLEGVRRSYSNLSRKYSRIASLINTPEN